MVDPRKTTRDVNRVRHLLEASVTDSRTDLEQHWRAWRRLCPDFENLHPIEYRLVPYVWRQLQAGGISDPEDTRLRGICKKVWFRNHHLLKRASQMQELLGQGGVESVLFKGCSLLLTAYLDSGARSSSNISLLIKPSDSSAASRILKKTLPIRTLDGYTTMFSAEDAQGVDVHHVPSQWSLARKTNKRQRQEQARAVIERGKSIEYASRSYRVPATEDLLFLHLLNLFAHTPHTSWAHAYWLVDLKQVFSAMRPSEDRLIQRIESEQCVALFQHHFRALAGLIPPVAQSLANRIASMQLTDEERSVDRVLSSMTDRGEGATSNPPQRVWWFALRGRDPGSASLGLKVEYARNYATTIFRNAVTSPIHRKKLAKNPAKYVAKGVSLLRS